MAYNKAKEERKWKQWKEREEKQMREYGMDEDAIQKLRNSDWEDFKADRCYHKRWVDYPEYSEQESTEDEEAEITEINRLLDIVSDKRLFQILKEADRKTLQIIIFKMMGFSTREIAEKMKFPEQTVYTRINRLKKKIKKVLESE